MSRKPVLLIQRLPGESLDVDDAGFRCGDWHGITWDNVTCVAMGYEIHPIAIADWDFWAFRTTDPTTTLWAYVESLSSPFSQEVCKRFSIDLKKVPPMRDWQDSEFNARAYILWPGSRTGEPLYQHVKRHWWSLCSYLEYADTQ